MRGLRLKTGFTATEIFRKYLWYLLRERKFDEDAVADLSALRSVLAMKDEDVSCQPPSLLMPSVPFTSHASIAQADEHAENVSMLLLVRWPSQKRHARITATLRD